MTSEPPSGDTQTATGPDSMTESTAGAISALTGRFLDGRSAKAWPARVEVVQNQWLITLEDGPQGPKILRFGADEVELGEASVSLPRRLGLPGGASLEVADQAGFDGLLGRIGTRRSFVDRAQNSWKMTVALLGLCLIATVAAYIWLLPWGAGVLARQVPPGLEKTLGEQAWPSIDKEYFAPSQLSAARQEALKAAFARLKQTDPALPADTQLIFRASKIGPNAIAIPGGRIVMTDELAHLASHGNDLPGAGQEALMGVLAHELGHLHYRHSMRSMIQAAAVTAVISLWLGDISTLVSAVPTLLLQMKYSRDFESEADDYAIQALDRLAIPREPTALLFEELMKMGDSSSVFASHPPSEERARKYRQATSKR